MSLRPPSATPQFFHRILACAQSWAQVEGKWWGMAILFHVLGLGLVGLLAGTVAVVMNHGDVPLLDIGLDTAIPESDLTQFDIMDAPLEPSELPPDLQPINEPLSIAEAEFGDSPEYAIDGGGLPNGTDGDSVEMRNFIDAVGPGSAGPGSVLPHPGDRKRQGRSDGDFVNRAAQRSAMPGGTKATERAVSGGLSWLARHQNADGSWSFDGHAQHCKDAGCTCEGTTKSDPGATAFALVPFLAAGQTHQSKGPYQKTISQGIESLGQTAKADGNLYGKTAGNPRMYVQGVATIVLCEAYGMTKDQRLRAPAQKAVEFICRSQHPELGGWHYSPVGEPSGVGDLSVVGWQLMALKSAKMAGLEVPPLVLEKAQKYLKSVSKGEAGGLGCYMTDREPTEAMTSVLLLSKQFLGAQRTDPAMQEGLKYMMERLPGETTRNSYYFYYATQAMHNMPGREWDEWNRATRKYLIETQEKKGCASGSWNPELPTKDPWADAGGRLLMTSINTLNLEVYYRFLPLYKLDKTGEKDVETEKPKGDLK